MWRKTRRCGLYLLCTWISSVVAFVYVIIPSSLNDIPSPERLYIQHASKVVTRNRVTNSLLRLAPVKISNLYYLHNTTSKSSYVNAVSEIKPGRLNPDPDAHARSIRHARQEAERVYYTVGSKRMSPVESNFLITNKHLCDQTIPYVLVIVPSMHRHEDIRNAIRNTYGSYAKKVIPEIARTDANVTTKLVFLFGRDSGNDTDFILKKEQKMYGDIVQANFEESYKNLTRKILMGLKWISMYCAEVEYVLKADEDVFVNIPELIHRLVLHPYGMRGAVYGYINDGAQVRRRGKWSVTKEQFPLSVYPKYASGNSYVLSGNIISKLVIVSEYFPYMPIEDAFVTGVLAKVIDASHTYLEGFTFWLEKAPKPCTFVREKRLSATKVTISLMYKLWEALQNFEKYCM